MLLWDKILKIIFPPGLGLSIELPKGMFEPEGFVEGNIKIKGGPKKRLIENLFVHLVCKWSTETYIARDTQQLPWDEIT